MTATVVFGAAALSGAGVTFYWTVRADRRPARRAARNLRAGLDRSTRPTGGAVTSGTRTSPPPMERIAREARRLAPTSMVCSLNDRILKAGMASRWPLERTLAAKVLLGAFGVLFGLLLAASRSGAGITYGLALPFALFFAPDALLRTKAKDRQKRIRIALPDTLDQITVCVEAGLGFEAAMARSARSGDGPLAEEIVRTLQDVQLGVPRKEAMRRLADRSDVEELRQFVLAIIQAEGYGIPIARVLRIQSAELREKRRQAAEERAMKISIKLLFPLVLCILPTTFIVILGPAVMRLMAGLSNRPM